MKQIITIITVVLLSILIGWKTTSFAATPSSTPSPTSSGEQQINDLKDRIASRVAQLKLVEKRGFIATVTDVSETQITATDSNGNIRFIDVDELTKFSSPSAKGSFGISDITKGSTIGVLGLYNKESRHLLARWVDVMFLPTVVNGVILSIDKDNFAFEIKTANKTNYNIDVENITKTLSYTSDTGLIKSGFSKLQEGQRVTIIGFFDSKDSTKIVASRILLFPNLPPDPQIPFVKPQDIAPVTSTGSGKKLTPIIK